MRLSFYEVTTEYCNYLRKNDHRVPYNMDEKRNRPFVGIVFTIGELKYFAPLSSPKPKHKNMKEQIDFIKIKNGIWGAINLNNMIPVVMDELRKIELHISEEDSEDTINYKKLLANQLTWCNSNREKIVKQASKLYNLINSGNATHNLLNRCCNFKKLEISYKNYSLNR